MKERPVRKKPSVGVSSFRGDKLYPKIVRAVDKCLARGKGPKQRLRFSKTGEPRIEETYSRCFVWPGKLPFHGRATRIQGDSRSETDGE